MGRIEHLPERIAVVTWDAPRPVPAVVRSLANMAVREGEVEYVRADLYEGVVEDLHAALNELGVPGPGYPAPVANAVEHINAALTRLGEQ